MTRSWVPQFGRFLGVGLVTTLLSITLIFAVKFFFGWGDALANAFGYAVGMLLNFHLNSQWTFEYQGPRGAGLVRFLVSSLIAYFANLLAVLLLIRYVHVNSYLAHVLGIPFYTVTSYLLSRTFVFRARPA